MKGAYWPLNVLFASISASPCRAALVCKDTVEVLMCLALIGSTVVGAKFGFQY